MSNLQGAEPHRWISVDDVLLSSTIPGRISDSVWDRYLESILELRPRHCVMLSDGAVEVDAAQRRRFTHAVMRTRSAVVVLTDNRVTRGWAMAVAWFGAKLDAYAWHDLARAVEGLGGSAETRQHLYDKALRFHAASQPIDG